MKSLRRKMILSSTSAILLLLTTVSTTFAWFSLNDSAWVEDFELGIENTENLLISTDGVHFKQSLNNADVVDAINRSRNNVNEISGLSDIVLSPITTWNGFDFKQEKVTYNNKNQKELSFVEANSNSFVQMSLYFTVESNGTAVEESEYPVYKLHFKTKQNEVEGGILGTSFSASNQTIQLKNALTTYGFNDDETSVIEKLMKPNDEIIVNPANAVRMAVKGGPEENSSNSALDYIYDVPGENDLGSYALDKTVLKALDAANVVPPVEGGSVTETKPIYALDKYDSSRNAMFTYYNNIQNGILSPMGVSLKEENEEQETQDFLDKIKNDYEDELGTMTFSQASNGYNVVRLDFSIWIEGFDADNLIGLNTTKLSVLLSFEMRAEQI